jgi:ribosomal-protein-alanine N-acetyltransferase
MEHFFIKPIKTNDIAALIDIAAECRLSPWSRRNFLDELQRTDAIMMRVESVEQATVGFLVGRIVSNGDGVHPYDAEIYNIGIQERARRQGLGRLLMAEFLSRCTKSNVKDVWLDVRLSNRGAIAFYERVGFVKSSVRKGFYADPLEDAIMMRLSLDKRSEVDVKNST